ncbi:PREDICTED: protein NRT1/ PTR FAMILY 5.9 [Theobroma cacao]|uniref:Protein NRT1/ PTR FAMILY 5.9 n=1 Tax=Theobroma cacao TaxID=3641 RepID=A0AB32WAF0_THECC|nr:PREDICTED: protein NRT1/ PTR FAMILY 5.9 [Theobroma cacao]XP_017975956.1 PREDICTED: protein NRT1/ PTR FAMILY 5.9 [Theobroma cacao]
MAGGGRAQGLSRSCILLIVIAGMERFAFKGVASNMVTYLTDVVKMSNSSAAKTVNSWCGFTSMLPLLVAPLADSFWDRYSTILTSSFLYVLGLGAVASTALLWTWSPPSNTSSSAFLFWSLCLISLGQGAYNPSLQAFGADQLDHDEELPCSKDDKSSNKKSLFFQWWYFGVCSGSLLGVILMSYIQDTFGWVLGFAIPMFAMVISVALFTCGSRIYEYKPVRTMDGKPFQSIVQVIKVTASKLIKGRISLPNDKSDVVELELQEKPLCDQKLGSKEGSELDGNPKNDTYLLENSKIILRLLPIWTMLLMFAVIFQQPATFFTKQGMTMERNIGRNFKIPPATLQSAITLSIILLMPLYDKVLIPITQIVTCNRKGISVMQRMGVGMFLSIIAMIIAAVVEMKRLEISKKIGVLESETVPLSIFWLLPQYVLLGISDIFTVVGMQEFFYNEVPVRMRTMGFALYTSVFGVGSFLSALMISIIEAFTSSKGRQSWFSDDMREDGLDKYYWLLALASALSLLLYAILCKCYKSRSEMENGSCK